MSAFQKQFCPLMSTAEKKVYCSSDCMWYCASDDDIYTCVVPVISSGISASVADIADAIQKKKK